MRVLVLGATGNLGTRLIPALLTHNHTVTAFVRSASKLEALLPASTYSQLRVIQGNAKDSTAIQNAITEANCDAVINSAGVAAMAPWGKSDLPEIFRAVLKAVRAAGQERGKPLRVWFLGGMGVLLYPGTQTMLSTYTPIFLEHRANLALLQSLPPNSVDWSLLCPAFMTAESTDFSVPTQASSKPRLVGNATTPPLWRHSWMEKIPLIGRLTVLGMAFGRYETTLEQAAEFLAADLAEGEGRFSGAAVGIVDGGK